MNGKNLNKAKEKKNKGLAYIHLFAPCPTGWGVPTHLAIELCRNAVRTNYFPLWEAEEGIFRQTLQVKKPKPISEYTKLIKKFSHLKEDELERIQEEVDYEYEFLRHLTEFRR